MMTIDQLNKMSHDDFVRALGGVYERSPWVAEQTWSQNPFPDLDTLIGAMRTAVDAADRQLKMELLKAHPDLAGKMAIENRLTAESKNEQTSLGLDRLSTQDHSVITDLNRRYRDQFAFPFIVCVRRVKDVAELIRLFRERIDQEPIDEMNEALDQVHAIADLRIRDLVE